MRRSLAAPIALALALAACASEPPAQPAAPARPAAALDVLRVIREEVAPGVLDAGSPFVVVLTRPVSPAPDALALFDAERRPISGTTVWLDRQVVAFYPSGPLPRGQALELRLTAPLRASSGPPLAPRALVALSTRPGALLRARLDGGRLEPMGHLGLRFDPPVHAADVSAHARITADGEPVAFSATDEGDDVALAATAAFPPGREIRVAWGEGDIAVTSAGRVSFAPFVTRAVKGLTLRVGGQDEHCVPGVRGHYRCATTRVSVTFSAPISDDEAARHIHPGLVRKTQGDLRGHRFELVLTRAAPTRIALDADLADTFGQRLGAARTLEITPNR